MIPKAQGVYKYHKIENFITPELLPTSPPEKNQQDDQTK
jgi:hypothetical protein